MDVVGPGLARITCRIGELKPLFQHVLLGGECWCFADTGIATTPGDYLLPALPALPRPPARQMAVVTHCDVDHFGGTAMLRLEFPSLLLCAHERDAPLIMDRSRLMDERYRANRHLGVDPPSARRAQLDERAGPAPRVDVALSGGEELDLDRAGRWRILHAPGHSSGHVVLVDFENRRAVIGDAVSGYGLDDLFGHPLTPPPFEDVDAYLATVELLESLRLEQLCTSHFPLLENGAVGEFLADSRAAVLRIGSEVREILADAELTLAELCEEVAARLGRWPQGTALDLADGIAAHVRAGEREGWARWSEGPDGVQRAGSTAGRARA